MLNNSDTGCANKVTCFLCGHTIEEKEMRATSGKYVNCEQCYISNVEKFSRPIMNDLSLGWDESIAMIEKIIEAIKEDPEVLYSL